MTETGKRAMGDGPVMLGVLGGMGPAAGAYFTYRLALLTSAASDQEHLPVLLVNDPRIPDRSEAVVGQGADPLPAMQQRLRLLEVNGCGCAVIPCNTAHHWHAQLQQSVGIPILHIVEAALAALRAQGVEAGPIGLLGTPATVQSDLYRRALVEGGYSVLPLSTSDIDSLCVRPIQAVKQNRVAQAAVLLAESIAVLRARGASAVILGCTELPLAQAALEGASHGIPIVDSIDALAASALRFFGLGVKHGTAGEVVSAARPRSAA